MATPARMYWFSGSGPGPSAAAVYGDARNGCLVRVHSRCTYSEAFASRECDCGWQLRRSRELLMRHSGVLVYLDQEGRGAGLWAKANAYRLYQEEGLDTFQAYEKLGIPADMRDYAGAAGILRELGITSAKLLTNNPEKAEALEQNGMTVTRVPLRMEPVPAAAAYLRAKKRHGHLLLLTAAWLSLAFHVRMWYSQPQEPGMEARDDNDVEWHGMHLAGG